MQSLRAGPTLRIACLLALLLLGTAGSKPPTAAETPALGDTEQQSADEVHGDTAAAVDQAQSERNVRDAAFKDEAGVADCK